MTADKDLIYMRLPCDRDVEWCGCCAACEAFAPTITVWTEGGELHITPGRWESELMQATAGRLFLAGIPIEAARKGWEIELTTSLDRLDDVVKLLHEAGAELVVIFDDLTEAGEVTSRLGGDWHRQR
jgi:hypothetical protein